MAEELSPDVPPRLSRAERRVKAAADVLRTLIRDLYLERFGVVPPEGADLDLVFRLHVQPRGDWPLTFNPPLPEQLFDQVQEAQADWEVFRRGHVYCYRCETSDCEHAAPASTLEVFAGYDSTGRPEWQELAQSFIASKDPRVDRLFADKLARHGARSASGGPDALALVQLGGELKGRQLAVFGKASKTYAVLGQVVAGYFRRDGERVAITFQAVEARGGDGRIRLHLNAIARLPDNSALVDALASGWAPYAHRALSVSTRAMESLERRAQGARANKRTDELREEMRRVPAILRRLAESLERGGRQSLRRTHHAQEQRQERRPVHKALDDAMAAGAESVFHDEKAETFVVCGEQGRAHAFNENGRHVTSFFIQPEAVSFRVRTQRWRPATKAEAETLKEKLRDRAAQDAKIGSTHGA